MKDAETGRKTECGVMCAQTKQKIDSRLVFRYMPKTLIMTQVTALTDFANMRPQEMSERVHVGINAGLYD